MQNEKIAVLIGIDWGTSSFRAYLMDEKGGILDTVSSGDGILSVDEDGFEDQLQKNIGHWLVKYPAIPLLASGMITSKNGWLETPYLTVPTSFDGFAEALSAIKLSNGHDINFVTGASFDDENSTPDIMRGEETQVIGALTDNNLASKKQLFLLPGTHSKWVVTEKEHMNSFKTFMTGEVYALLKEYSILGTLMQTSKSEITSGFLKGVINRQNSESSLLHQLFSARTLALFDQLPSNQIADYLSGLLIGEEIRSASTDFDDETNVQIIGGEELVSRYALALDQLKINYQIVPNDIVSIGHFKIAKKAGLLS